MASKIPDFQSTSIDTLASIANKTRTTFRSQKTKPLSYRLVQLRKFYWGLVDNSDAIIEACKRDLHKPAYETILSELDWVKNDIVYVTHNLEKWAAEEKAEDIPLTFSVMNARIRKEPLGTVLIIGAFNFPIQLTLGPLVGAIAAGCTAIIKPSEQAPATAMLMQKIIAESLDPEAYVVVNGGVPETTALLEEKWDKIFYTGGQTVGTIIAKKAAETLTPVTLELGGRNPAIVTRNADMRLAARRLFWGKLHNAGQVCIGQNYILVDRQVLPELVTQLKIAMKEFYPQGMKNSEDYARIVNKRNFQRIKKMIDETQGRILIGGETDESENYIEITVVEVKDHKDSMIVQESFGPLIPLLAFDDLDEAIRIANEVDPTPLGFYPFGTASETNKLLNSITSGGASVNDAFTHGSISTISFGGVGQSGTGSYRGRASFDCFTHRRSVTTTPGWIEKLLDVRYPPYAGKIKRYRFSSEKKPNFDREGREIKGVKYWMGVLFGLGLGKKVGFLFWGVLLFGVYVGKVKRGELIAGGKGLLDTLLK